METIQNTLRYTETVYVGKRFPCLYYEDFTTNLNNLHAKANKRTCLSHYTNIEALLAIFTDCYWKASRIDNVDDVREQQYICRLIEQNESLPYVISFDHSKSENIALWCMYTLKEAGVMITLEKKSTERSVLKALLDTNRKVRAHQENNRFVDFSHWLLPETTTYSNVGVYCDLIDIDYHDTSKKIKECLPAKNMKNRSLFAAIKASEWKFQNETRVISDFELMQEDTNYDGEEIPIFDYLLLPITFERLHKITITFSPWMGEYTKYAIRHYIESLPHKCPIIFNDSKFTKLIQRK